MNTSFLKDSRMISIGKLKTASPRARLHFYAYLLALLIFYGVMYSAYGAPSLLASQSTDTSATASTSTTVTPPTTTPVAPVPDVNPSLDSLIGVFTNAAPSWGSTLVGIAKNLFYLLATIEIFWTGIRLTLRQADLMEWASELVYQVLFIGFFLALLTNSATWSQMIIQSFNTAGQTASAAGGGPTGISPTNIFKIGYEIANNILSDVPFIKSGDSFFLVLSSLIVLSCSALIAAFMILTLIETYLAVYGGIIFMGFGGSRFTSQIAIKTLMYTFAAGAKLFFVQLLGGLTETQLTSLLQEFKTFTTINNTIIFKIIGMCIILMIIIKRAPEILQSMLNGINFDFSFAAPIADSGHDTPQTSVTPSSTVSALKASLAAVPSGYIPPGGSGMFDMGTDSAALESLGSRLTDIQNTSLYASEFMSASNFNPENPPFDLSPRIIPTSGAGDSPNVTDINTTLSAGAGATNFVSGQIGAASENARNNAAISQDGSRPIEPAAPPTSRLDAASQGAGYQPAGLGGRFGSDPRSADSLTDTSPTFGPLSQGTQQGGGGTTSTLDRQSQANAGVEVIPGIPGQTGQNTQGISSTTSTLGGQSQTGVEVIPGTPGQTSQGTQGITSSASPLSAQQLDNNISAAEKASISASSGIAEDMGGKLASDLPNTTMGTNTPTGSIGQTSSIADQTPSATTTPSSTAPGMNTTPSPATSTMSGAASSSATLSSAVPSTPSAPASAATPSSSASSATVAPTSMASGSAAPSTPSAPASAATPSSSASSATAAPASATPAPTTPTSTAPASTSDSKTPSNSADGNKGAGDQKSDSNNKKPDDKSVDNDKKSDDKKPEDDDKKADSNDKDKASDQDKQDDDKKKKPEDPNKNDDSFDDKPKKPHTPKDDHNDKK